MTTLDDVRFLLGQIDGKVTLLVDQGKIQDDRHNALDTRVQVVERRQAWYAGASAIFGAGLGAALTSLVKGLFQWR